MKTKDQTRAERAIDRVFKDALRTASHLVAEPIAKNSLIAIQKAVLEQVLENLVQEQKMTTTVTKYFVSWMKKQPKLALEILSPTKVSSLYLKSKTQGFNLLELIHTIRDLEFEKANPGVVPKPTLWWVHPAATEESKQANKEEESKVSQPTEVGRLSLTDFSELEREWKEERRHRANAEDFAEFCLRLNRALQEEFGVEDFLFIEEKAIDDGVTRGSWWGLNSERLYHSFSLTSSAEERTASGHWSVP
jgi:hypothetical protein